MVFAYGPQAAGSPPRPSLKSEIDYQLSAVLEHQTHYYY